MREYSQRRTGTLPAPREFPSTTSKPLAVVRSLTAASPPFRMTITGGESSRFGRCIGSCDGRTTCPLYRLRRDGIRFSIKVNSLFTGELSICARPYRQSGRAKVMSWQSVKPSATWERFKWKYLLFVLPSAAGFVESRSRWKIAKSMNRAFPCTQSATKSGWH